VLIIENKSSCKH